MEHSAVSVKKQPYPLFKSLRLKKSSPLMNTADSKRVHIIKSIIAPSEPCMLQKWSYHQKHCRPFQHYMLQKSSYQTAVSPQSSNSLSQQPSKRGGWVPVLIMQEQNKCSEYFNPAIQLVYTKIIQRVNSNYLNKDNKQQLVLNVKSLK